MKILDMNNSDRKRNYEWFKDFSNSTYSCNVEMDVTEIVNFSKESKTSFFINMLYVVTRGLNSIEEMRMRLDNDKPVIFDEINPAFTIITTIGVFENVRHKYFEKYSEFYDICHEHIEKAKNKEKISKDDYNPKDTWNEFYITSLPWVSFTQFTHPIPDSKESQCVPRVCWGKYFSRDNRIFINLNITASHIFVDGYPLSKAFIAIQELLDNARKILK